MATARSKSFTFKLTPEQQGKLEEHLNGGNYLPIEVPHTRVAVDAEGCKIMLYKTGKCLVQGGKASDWVQFTLEPLVLQEIVTGYDNVRNPEWFHPHMGVDESGKGDFFGPMVISAVYSDEELIHRFQEMGVKDSKKITSDRKALELARDLRGLLGDRFASVVIGPRSYNRLYATMRSVNSLLAWGHARAIENLLETVPGCPRAVSDQFGPKRQIEQALMKKGRAIELVQRPKAEEDPAVAAASILARAGFLDAVRRMEKQYDQEFPKGASQRVLNAAREMVDKLGADTLLVTAKCHFKTTDKVLYSLGLDRGILGQDGQVVSKTRAS